MLLRPRSWRRALFQLAVLGGLLGLPGVGSTSAAPRTAGVRLPAYGEITVARIPVTVASARQARRLRRRLPAARVRNRPALPTDAPVYAGVRFKPGSRRTLEALVVALRPQPAILPPGSALPGRQDLASAAAAGADSAAAAARIGLRVPRGVRLRWGPTSQEVGAFSKRGAPRALCAVRLRRRARVRAQLVAGPPLSYPKGASAKPRTVLAQALAAACGRRYDPAFRAAIGGRGGPGPPPASGAPALTWSYLDAQKLQVVGDVVADTAFDRLEIRVPGTTFADPHGPPNESRRVVSFKAPPGLPSCSVAATHSPGDTLVCAGGTVAAGEHQRLQVRSEPPPADGMGGQFTIARGMASRGPFQVSGP